MNDSHQIVGTYSADSQFGLGFLLENGNLTRISYPGALLTTPAGINDLGDIVGSYVVQNAPFERTTHPFLLHKNVFSEIVIPGASALNAYASGINNCGQIVGSYSDASGISYGFIATPSSTGVSSTGAQAESGGPRKHCAVAPPQSNSLSQPGW